ncbi:MAG: hypothetical protein MZV70_71755 [Desulfobacterales bacterium]|nr:hypothetical protein [Desulfobacterales bacterium]
MIACGVMGSGSDRVHALGRRALLRSPLMIKNGQMIPPQRPGLGLEIPEEIIQRFRVE